MNRYSNEANRLYGVLDRQLAKHEFVAGDSYSIADIAEFFHGRVPISASV